MSNYQVKIPKNLNRVEIIRSNDAMYDNVNIFESFDDLFTKLGVDYKNNSLRGKEPGKKSGTYFVSESFLPSVSPLIKLESRNTNLQPVPIQIVQEEIQHAYDRGFDEAQQLTRTTFEIELQKRQHWVLNFDSIFNNMRTHFRKEIINLEDSVIPLAIMVAEHILGREVTSGSDIVIEQVKKAIKNLDTENILKVRLHPYNIEILKSVGSNLVADSSRTENMIIVADENVDLGSCILETTVGTIDATFKSQLEKMLKILKSSSDIIRTTVEDFENNQDASNY